MNNKIENKTSQNHGDQAGKAWDLSKNVCGTFQFKTYFTSNVPL